MALLFMDSFDHYATADLTGKWTGGVFGAAIMPGAGRRGSSALRCQNTGEQVQTGTLPVSGTTVILGLAVKVNTLFWIMDMLSVRTAAGSQFSLTVSATGLLEVRRGDSGGTLLGSTGITLVIGTVYHVEVKAVVDPTGGTIDVRVNGTTVLSLTGQNTANTGVAGWTAVRLGGETSNGPGYDFDDLYVLDGSGPAPRNNFLGDCRVDARAPTGAGATTGWTPSTAPNWSCVDDAAPNGDTDYVTAASSGLTDTYAVQDAPVAGGTIYGVQLLWHMKKLDTGTCSVAPVVRHSGTNQVGPAQDPAITYGYGRQVYGTNPGTSAAWTDADFNAAEFGCTRTA